MSMYVLVCVFKIFFETIVPTVAKFHGNHNGIGEENLFKLFRSFVVLHLNIVNFAGLLPQMWPRSAGLLAGLWKLKS